ncbi:MAG: molybdenum cofactor guanylyltransferase [Alphaproteobacteria bacterium]|nr:molybdenum cofactor guanylyltransferase [Alphaproteobacteria bacterium]
MSNRKIAGVVLAGGLSSRMGRDKARLDYHGRPMIDHMIGVLQSTGLDDIYVSGNYEGYRCIPDVELNEGPARAICNVLQKLIGYDGILFVPVDMPLLNMKALDLLIQQREGGYFKDFPLPAFVTGQSPEKRVRSIKEFLSLVGIKPLTLPADLVACMKNINTPEEWKEVCADECQD